MVSLRRCRPIAFLAAALLIGGCGGAGSSTESSALPPDPAVVTTAQGDVRGVVAPDHRFFGGLPYAAPPVGALRWQPPAPAQSWTGLRKATRVGPRCIQDVGDPEIGRQTDEDCLTLNVWTPPASQDEGSGEGTDEGTKAELKPVMVWIHGGAFINGSSGIYDSKWLTTRGDIVVVTLNYRLGTLGFLAHPSLGPAGAVGNYGLADQQAALRWVHDNIAAFGGDPDKVTIAGESAGGMSVCDHLVAPGSKDLFDGAIIQSGPCQAQLALPEAERISVDYARDVGCGDPATAAACLRALPAKQLRDPVQYFRIGDDALSGPVTGTETLPVDPMAAFAAGDAARVPLLIGSNRDEFTLFLALEYLRGQDLLPAEYPGVLEQTFGRGADAVAARYPLDRYGGNAPLAYSAAVTDGEFACVDQRITADLSRESPVYAYEFNDRNPPMPEPFRTLPFPVGASHSLELRYLFDVGGAPPLNPAQQTLSDQMIDYWSEFIRTGAPKADGLPEWPEAGDDPARSDRLSFVPDDVQVADDFTRVHQCDFWATLQR
ncbi:carboxylesterase/lipase family protein [Mycolicibacterium sp. GCM10028919]|uniref:carboxylesterase/lipase family protein n=1 Tax=Mycolicibacterium sp. GCM10028919 TaxID=3273401 RepID=UPI00360A28F4